MQITHNRFYYIHKMSRTPQTNKVKTLQKIHSHSHTNTNTNTHQLSNIQISIKLLINICFNHT